MPMHLSCNKRELLPRVGVDNLEQCVSHARRCPHLSLLLLCVLLASITSIMKIAAGVLDRGGRVPRVFVLMFFCFAFFSHQRLLLKCQGNVPLACSDHQDDAWWLVRARLPDWTAPPCFSFLGFFFCVFLFF